jgi:riboflavin biosynthesis pyrimidine reductase
MAFAACIAAGGAAAQTPSQRPADDPLSVKPISPQTQTTDMEMIRARIERIGYSNVTGLSRDSLGVWHAHAMRNNEPVDIIVDKGGRIKPEAR